MSYDMSYDNFCESRSWLILETWLMLGFQLLFETRLLLKHQTQIPGLY